MHRQIVSFNPLKRIFCTTIFLVVLGMSHFAQARATFFLTACYDKSAYPNYLFKNNPSGNVYLHGKGYGFTPFNNNSSGCATVMATDNDAAHFVEDYSTTGGVSANRVQLKSLQIYLDEKENYTCTLDQTITFKNTTILEDGIREFHAYVWIKMVPQTDNSPMCILTRQSTSAS